MTLALPARPWALTVLVLGLFLGGGTPLPAHPHDPGYMRRAADRLLAALSTPAGREALERAGVRLGAIALEPLAASAREPLNRDEALRVAREALAAEVADGVRGSGLVEEAGELLLYWGGVEAPDAQARARLLLRSGPTRAMLRRLTFRLRRRFRIPAGEAAVAGINAPAISPEPRAAPPADGLEARRIRWARELLPRGIPAPPVPVPILRFDADGDGYAETRALDVDLDGSPDRLEADLDGDQVFETGFELTTGGYQFRETPHGKLMEALPPPVLKDEKGGERR